MGYLHEVPEDGIGTGVCIFDVFEPVTETQRDGLLPQIRQLAAGYLVVVYPSGRGGQADSNGA